MAAGLTPRAVLDKLAGIQMLDVHFPTTDGRNADHEPVHGAERRPEAALAAPRPHPAAAAAAAHCRSRSGGEDPVAPHVVETFGSLPLIPRPFPLARYLG